MGEVSDISWTDATHNEWIGCTKVSPGCANCYAETLMDTRYHRVKWGKGQERKLTSEANRRKPLAWDKAAAKAGKRTRVFSSSLSDWLDDEVPAIWLGDLLTTVESTPNLDWLMLTKRPQNWRSRLLAAQRAMMPRVNGFIERWLAGDPPPNVWVGTTTEDQKRADERVPRLCDIPARVRFLSMEPLLGPIDLPGDALVRPGGVDWIIVGGESGHGARPIAPDWVRSLRDQSKEAGVAFHFKQWGEWAPRVRMPVAGQVTAEIPTPEGVHFQLVRVGKTAAGREIDGRTWDEFPEVTHG